MAVAQVATWLSYGLEERDPLQVVTNGVCVVLHLAVLAVLLALDPAAHDNRVLLPQAAPTVAWLGAVAACALTPVRPAPTPRREPRSSREGWTAPG